ncbi:Vacuolar fusion protein MON1-like protein A [Cryptotermes secundus]|uniref:Vacuolar fusion protein MON1 homolog n=2 Tax=Cryptotermes secundus TaxID=105785 RepID=A0A2J7Q9G0_9NEOP|nr:protein SAND [Cryptotermes secundus]PNF25223.1 Vacuolar fusion protein MON1-like protein A [Cryptotermes secundus]
MASKGVCEEKKDADNNEESDVVPDFEPGASLESMLVTTDSFEELEQEMDSSFDERQMKESTTSTISEIQEELNDTTVPEDSSSEQDDKIIENDEVEEIASQLSETSLTSNEDANAAATPVGSLPEEDYWQNPEWKERKKHVFILSAAGKPIYSRYGTEDKLVTIFGVMQALVSFVQTNQDTIRSIHTGNSKFVFLIKGPIILVSVSRTTESVSQLVLQLTYVYNQVVSVLTSSQLNRIYEQRRNYDLRRLLAGAERLIDHLLNFMEREPAFLLGAVKCLPLTPSVRDSITQTIVQTCGKIKNLVFAILLAKSQLITLVRMKKYFIHPADLHLIFNLVNSSESFKASESWTPICLPKFDSSGFLYGHVSYLSDDCQACLLLLTVDRDVFFTLSEAKQKIVEKLRRSNCLEAINESVNRPSYTASQVGVPEMRHFLYKCKSTAQFWSPALEPPYHTTEESQRLLGLYQALHHHLHAASRPLKLLHQQLDKETMLGWVTSGFELYVTFEPLITKHSAINAVNKLLRWIKKEEDRLFILNAPTF